MHPNHDRKWMTTKKLLLAIMVCLFLTSCIQNETWKQRWEADTAALSKDLKDANDKITEMSLNLRLANSALTSSMHEIKAMQSENVKLEKELKNIKCAIKDGRSHWKSQKGVRHKRDCPSFGTTASGAYCKPNDGLACEHCGG